MRVSQVATKLMHNPSTGFSPYVAQLSSAVHDVRFIEKVNGGEMVPFAQVTVCGAEIVHWAQWWEVAYIAGSDVTRCMKPSPPSRCLSRAQIETVAAALTGALGCAF